MFKKKRKRKIKDMPKAQYKELLAACKSNVHKGFSSHQSDCPSSKSLQIINAGEGVEIKEPSYTVDVNVHWYSHYGEQYKVSLKTKTELHMILQSHSWAFIWRKL